MNFLSWEAMLGGARVENFQWKPPDPQQVLEARELHAIVLEAVDTLSPKNRSATLMFYFEQLSLTEIAMLLGISTSAVKGRLYKSRQHLRESLRRHLEPDEDIQREKRMIKVTIADVVQQHQEQEGEEKVRDQPHVLVLLDKAGQRALPIWVGPYEGQAIASGVLDFPAPRPMTFTFVANLLEAAHLKIEAVQVETLMEDTFYAVVKLRNRDRVDEIDARPSDAIALAVRSDSPIYVSEGLMDQAGVDVSDQLAQAPRLGKGLDGLLEKMESERAKWEARKAAEAPTAKTLEQVKQDVIADVFGS